MARGQKRLDPKARRAAQAEATRAALVDAARRLFVAKGYHGTGTEEVVAEANAGTRGALYHHFADKKALFEAVFIAVEEDLVTEAAKNLADPADGALNLLRQGLIGFLNASLTPLICSKQCEEYTQSNASSSMVARYCASPCPKSHPTACATTKSSPHPTSSTLPLKYLSYHPSLARRSRAFEVSFTLPP